MLKYLRLKRWDNLINLIRSSAHWFQTACKISCLTSSGPLDNLLTRFSFAKMPKSEKGHNSNKNNLTEKKKIRVSLFFISTHI